MTSYAKRCTRCGFCNAVCAESNVSSAFRESRTSRGRMVLVQSLVENVGNIDPYSTDFKRLIDLCLSCRRCVSVCPPGIPIPDLMVYARYAHLKRKKWGGLTLGHRIYADYGTFDRLGSATAPISNWIMGRRAVKRLMESATHIDARTRLPPFQRHSFESWFRKRSNPPREKKVVYFVDSYANYNYPPLAKTVVALLEHLGYQVIVPPQKESGMPSLEFGLLDKARILARYNLGQLTRYAEDGIPIVCSSLAASYLLKEGYGSILDGGEVSTVSKAVVDLMELLLEEYEKGAIHFGDQIGEHVDYHCCCLSRAMSLAPVNMKLLKAAGLVPRQIDECCGGAGVWGTFKENFEMGREIAQKLGEKLSTGTTLLTESETCRMQIEQHTGATVRFPFEILAERVSGLQGSQRCLSET
jgi:glycerol-3-phosphate dehydrogenase subunit C